MALGQPLLRSQTGGWSEQLDPGMNGFDLGLPGLMFVRNTLTCFTDFVILKFSAMNI